MGKQMEGDNKQRRQRAREAQEAGTTAAEAGATLGGSKQDYHLGDQAGPRREDERPRAGEAGPRAGRQPDAARLASGGVTMTVRKIVISVALASLLVACGGDSNGGQASDDTQGGVERVAEDVREGAEDAASAAAERLRTGWASLETNAERLVDRIKTDGDSEAKQELLDDCRDRLQDARAAGSDQADRIEGLCDRVRDTDVNAGDTWDEIRKQIEDIEVG